MNLSRKLLFFGLIMVLSIGFLVGCGNGDENGNGNGNDDADDGTWPEDDITIVIPFGAGGSADTLARSLAPYWEEELGGSLVVENYDGAASQVGTTMFMEQPADGSAVFIGTQLYKSATMILREADYELDDFHIINFQQFDPVTITVHKDSPYDTFDDLIDEIKANPGEIDWGTIHGGPLHLAGEILRDELDLDFNMITYDGGSDMRNALLGQHVDFIVGNANGDRALEGEARVLAVGNEDGLEIWPDAKTFDKALVEYDLSFDTFPAIGSARFVAVHSEFVENYPDRYETLVETYKAAFENSEFAEQRKETGAAAVSNYFGPEEAQEMNRDMHNLLERYQDELQ